MYKTIIYLIYLSFVNVYSQNTQGFIIYKASLISRYEYPESLKLSDPDIFNEFKKVDSLINMHSIGVVFNKNNSKSFNTKPFTVNASSDFSSLYKINFDAEYFYDVKSKTSKISREFWLKNLLVTVDLNDKWEIDLTKSKTIDGYKCYYARYKGQYMWAPSSNERVISAWFTTEIPLPYGPLHYNGLPGLIIELNDDNVRFTATKISFDKTHLSKLKPIDQTGKDKYSEQEFILNRDDIRRKAKRITTGG